MALPSAQGKPASLTLRIVSGAVMLPAAVGAVWLGGWVFAVLVAVVAGLMYWEWQGLCGERGGRAIVLAVLCAVGPLLLALTGVSMPVIALLAIGFLVTLILGGKHRFFMATGFEYIFFACAGMVWLRGLEGAGMETVIWLLAVVVVTDTAAYFTGRTLGGPKLAPRISPKKTWSGLIGGIVGAGVAGGLVATGFEGTNIVAAGLLGGAFAVIAQAGDLLISKAKRTFNVKDSGNLIPGHGGVLDRLDGFLSTSLALAVLTMLGGGSPLT